jgi:DnaJ-class molecular chaperone
MPDNGAYVDLLPALSDEERCKRCEGDGSFSQLAPCTTFGPDCACNGPRVIVDPCPDCGGSGRV